MDGGWRVKAVLERLLANGAIPWVAALLAVALVAPSLGGGWFLDDLWHRAGATKARELAAYLGEAGDFAGPMRMYAFWDGDRARTEQLIDRGIIPWWSDPAVRIAFWRPLSALTHELDYALWPGRAFLMHAQSTLWLALLVVAAGLSHRRVIGATWVAGLAALLFALSDAHALPAAWLANRHALVAGCLALSSFYAHLRGRAAASRPWAIAARITFALSLLASEAGVVVVAYLAAYVVALERAPWRARLAALVPYAVIVGVWRLTYTGLGYGVVGSSLYVDPAGDPLRFLRTEVDPDFWTRGLGGIAGLLFHEGSRDHGETDAAES
jgi:hypothetical protein